MIQLHGGCLELLPAGEQFLCRVIHPFECVVPRRFDPLFLLARHGVYTYKLSGLWYASVLSGRPVRTCKLSVVLSHAGYIESLGSVRAFAGRRLEFGLLGRIVCLSRFDALANIGSHFEDFSGCANLVARELPQGHNERCELV